jgi:hypothetical protein
MKQDETIRQILVRNIKKYSEDEFENPHDVWDLAEESEKQLLMRLVNILEYYEEQNNS